MNTLDNIKLRSEILALHTKLKASEAYDEAEESFKNLRKRIADKDIAEDVKEAQENYTAKLNSIIDHLRNKSADSLIEIEQFLDELEGKIRKQ